MSRQLTVYCIVFALIVSLSTFFTPHKENDEQIYLTLAKRITCQHVNCFLFDFTQYNLLGSAVLNDLVDPAYHNTVFFHPPAFIMTLSLAYRVGGEAGMKMVPILVYLLIVYMIYKILDLLEVSKITIEIGILLSVCSPLLLFNTQKLWLDLFMGCMLIVSFYFLLNYVKRKKAITVVLSGLFFFLAVFTKYWAFISFVPFVLFLIIHLRKKAFVPLLAFSFPLLFLVLNYFLKIIPISTHPIFNGFLHPSGVVAPSLYPFIEYVRHRPLLYYFYSMLIINPAYMYIGFVTRDTFKRIMHERSFLYSIMIFFLCFILYSLAIFSIFGLLEGGFQTRYVLFIEPFIILFACLLIEKSKNKQLPLLFLFLVHNIVLVMMNVLFLNGIELFPFIEMFWPF